MSNTPFYIFFFGILLISISIDVYMLKKKREVFSFKSSVKQTLLWVSVALIFGLTLFYFKNYNVGIKYISGYLIEWSLSIDNIFVFILIFSQVKLSNFLIQKILLIGILLAIIFRVIFIFIGVELIEQFHWILYIFGFFLIYVGVKMCVEKKDKAPI